MGIILAEGRLKMGHGISNGLVAALRGDFDCAKKRGNGAAVINLAFGHSETSSWAYQVVEGSAAFPISQVETWMRVTGGGHLVRWMAAQADSVLVMKPKSDVNLGSAHKAVQAFAGFLGRVASATDPAGPSGRRVSREEAAEVYARSVQAASVILSVGERMRQAAFGDGRCDSLAESFSQSPEAPEATPPRGNAASPGCDPGASLGGTR